VNDLIVTRLAGLLGLPVPEACVIEVDQWLIDHSPGLRMELRNQIIPCRAGLHFASRYVVDPGRGSVFDMMPVNLLWKVRNVVDFAGMLVLDLWTSNVEKRQAVFWRKPGQRKYTATFIDHGSCFSGTWWQFCYCPRLATYSRPEVYSGVTGIDSFRPWLMRMIKVPSDTIKSCTRDIPAEWYGNRAQLDRLITELDWHRCHVPDLLYKLQECAVTNPFPNWRGSTSFTMMSTEKGIGSFSNGNTLEVARKTTAPPSA
jgi:hypothetical protein